MEHPVPGPVRPLPSSRLYLHALGQPPATLVDFMCAVYPHVSKQSWNSRADRGRLTLADGTPVTRRTPYLPGETICYEREVHDEPDPESSETILFEDDCLVVADKPHGMPVTPSGNYLARSLLVRLRQHTGVDRLVPAHRLDRDTAGVVVFVKEPAHRGLYHALWAGRRVLREYHARSAVTGKPDQTRWRIGNRIERGTPWFRQRIVPGPPNALTEIRLLGTNGDSGLFLIRPETGKKHQIRVHMAEIGFPILGDVLYPELADPPVGTLPLQLVASGLSFTDPITGTLHAFASRQPLNAPAPDTGARRC